MRQGIRYCASEALNRQRCSGQSFELCMYTDEWITKHPACCIRKFWASTVHMSSSGRQVAFRWRHERGYYRRDRYASR